MTTVNNAAVIYTGETTKTTPFGAGNASGGLTTKRLIRSPEMAVSKRTRFEVLRRDNYTCRYCRSADNPLTVDHVTPRALGGGDGPDNLVAACKDCNAGKTSTSPDEHLVADVAAEELAWAANLRAALDQYDNDLQVKLADRADFLAAWNRWTYPDGDTPPLPDDWECSVDQWSGLGVTVDTMAHAVRIAMNHPGVKGGDEFRYAAGVVWSIVRECGGL